MMRHGLAIRTSKRFLHSPSQKKICCHQHSNLLGASNSSSHAPTTCSVPSRRIYIQPHPMTAVAYDYDDYDCDFRDDDDDDILGGDSCDAPTSHHDMMFATSAFGGRNGSNSGVGPIAIGDNTATTPRFVGSGGGGGVGGGGHRCPKCGANVTFQEGNSSATTNNSGGIQSNCFYCAVCSGWFLIQPTNLVDDDVSSSASAAHSKYLLSKLGGGADGEGKNKILPTSHSNRNKITHPQFVMQHVSSFSRSLFYWLLVCTTNVQYIHIV